VTFVGLGVEVGALFFLGGMAAAVSLGAKKIGW
jgi:hypothetical protein